MSALLELQTLRKAFGGLVAIDNVAATISANAIHGLIGPNGAGKTTLFSIVTGFYRADAGKVVYDGADVTRFSTAERARRGLVRTFQSNLLFVEQTTLENVATGALISRPRHAFDWFSDRAADHDEALWEARQTLDFCRLGDKAETFAIDLSHGQQRVLGIAVALAAKPRLLLLDEPFTGMTAGEKDALVAMIRAIRDRGTTIVLVEHDMRAVMQLCDRITVLNFGKVIAEGTPEEVRRHPEVMAAYLGAGA
jgi:branched-chain amino acid transport system ATP-binding protein